MHENAHTIHFSFILPDFLPLKGRAVGDAYIKDDSERKGICEVSSHAPLYRDTLINFSNFTTRRSIIEIQSGNFSLILRHRKIRFFLWKFISQEEDRAEKERER